MKTQKSTSKFRLFGWVVTAAGFVALQILAMVLFIGSALAGRSVDAVVNGVFMVAFFAAVVYSISCAVEYSMKINARR